MLKKASFRSRTVYTWWSGGSRLSRIRHGGMDGFYPLVDFSQILYRSIVLGICLKDWKKGGIPRRGTRPENPGV